MRVELDAPGRPCAVLPAADSVGGGRADETVLDVGVTPGEERGGEPVPQPLRLHVHLRGDGVLIAGLERTLQLEP